MSGEVVRLAFAFGHLGSTFHGSQVQPALRTVQGHLQEELTSLGFIEHSKQGPQPCVLASRTDAGVNVRMNVSAIDMPLRYWLKMGESGFLKALNDQLDGDIVVWAAQPTISGWNPRRALSRTYRYRLETLEQWRGSGVEELESWLKLFIGEHDFSNFCRRDEVPNKVREVLQAKAWVDEGREEVIGFEIRGRAFLWNMVRRIASALTGLSNGTCTTTQVEQALAEPMRPLDLGLSPSDWLILWEVEHEGVEFCNFARTVGSTQNFSTPPNNKSDARRFQRWVEKARLEQMQLCHAQWDQLMHG